MTRLNFWMQGLLFGILPVTSQNIQPDTISTATVKQIPDSLITDTDSNTLNEVVISGTLKAIKRDESPVPVEVYSANFFKKNPTPSLFEGLHNINGVRPQLNCNICNTGDIHINGLEGPYTLVLIDGMPIVSGLGSVYGLSGIPNSLIDRIEVVKGPASSLYGSEAIGGLINIITKKPENTALATLDIFANSWGETNMDAAYKWQQTFFSVLTGVNYFKYSNPKDKNNDGFTDVTLQDRISVFQKWNFHRRSEKLFSMMTRYLYEDRWGGQMNFTSQHRGGNQVYGESIYTNRLEVIGAYEFAGLENLKLNVSYNYHNQNSFYGETPYLSTQQISFVQLLWDKEIGAHDLLLGGTYRYQYYDDNTPATWVADHMNIPGIFVQDDIKISKKHQLLLGARYDYNSRHGSIFTPRLAYRFQATPNCIARFNTGSGFRVVNLFTEDHAALTGARDVIITEHLKPEKSWNFNLNILKKFPLNPGLLSVEFTAWHTYFSNAILPDYTTNSNQIIYKNSNGNAITQGVSLNIDYLSSFGLKAHVGATLMDVSKTQDGVKTNQILTEKFSGTWNITYSIPSWSLTIDYTGNVYGPMALPLAGDLDPRPDKSPFWSIQNIQFTYQKFNNLDIYFGLKNLLNFTPNKHTPFLIARAYDPFNQHVDFDASGQAIPTHSNPYGLTFDPSYMYSPNQGIRTFAGLRYTFR